MVRKFVVAAGIVLSVANSAFSADALTGGPADPPIAVPKERQFAWSGGYAGFLTGYGWGDITPSLLQLDVDGARLDAFVGYNFEIRANVYLGAEAELGYDWSEDTSLVSGATVDSSTGLNGTARARLGYGADRALFYLAGGYAATELNAQSDALVEQSETLHGWTIGVGADYAVTDKIITRIEYRHTDFGDIKFAGDSEEVGLTQQTVKIGLGIKF